MDVIQGTPIESSGAGMVSVAWADDYFSRRLGASRVWTADAEKAAALATAEMDLEARFGALPVLDVTRRAICEQALFRLQNAGLEKRAGLQAQGVTSAGIVGESYAAGAGHQIPISAYAVKLMGGAEAIYTGTIERDPDEILGL